MTSTILVAGATGYLGRHLVAELASRGHRVRAVVRDRERAERPGAWDAPALQGLVDEWVVGDVCAPVVTEDAASGVDGVVSALGVTRQGSDPWQVDLGANRALLASASRHGVRSFCYVGVLGGEVCPAPVARAKTAFAAELAASDVPGQVVNPAGYFSDVAQLLILARRGRVYLLDPEVRISPLHGADLAAFCADRLESGVRGTFDVGGPSTFTWREVAELAFDAVGRPARVTVVPPWLVRLAIAAVHPFARQKAGTMTFLAWGLTHDGVGPPTGTHRLRDFLVRHAGR